MADKILVIEDEDAIREGIAELLTQEDFEVVQAENGPEGVQKAIKEQPQLVLCDIVMPGMDGYQVLEFLRQTPDTSLIPLIFLTARSSHEEYREGMKLGADDYLIKPFTNQELLETVRTRLERQSLLIQRFSSELKELNSLKKNLKELEQKEEFQEQIFQVLFEEIRGNLAKMNLAIYMLKKECSAEQRKRYLRVLQEECAAEMELLDKVAELRHLLTPDNLQFLQNHNLLGQVTGHKHSDKMG